MPSYGALDGISSLVPGAMGNSNVVHTYQALIQSIQNLIKLNPDFMRNGIPNNLIQMCMEQTKFPNLYNVSNFEFLLKLFLTIAYYLAYSQLQYVILKFS